MKSSRLSSTRKGKVGKPLPDLQPVFARLRGLLKANASGCNVGRDVPGHFSLQAPVGPATLRVWSGKLRSPTMPVAWVQVGKAYVSYHLMGVYGHPQLMDAYSKELKARMQGKSCFNFKTVDEPLFEELQRLTVASITGMRRTGYITD